MRMLELFSGSAVMSKTFKKYGFDTLTVDIDESLTPDIVADVNNLGGDFVDGFDVIWASFPCTYHSRYSFIHGHWKDGKPNSRECLDMCHLHIHALQLIRNSGCKVWFIENGRSELRHMNYMQNVGYLHELCYCMYGDVYKKPTDIWSNIRLDLKMCNHSIRHKSFQNSYNYNGVNDRSVIPLALCESIVKQTVDYLVFIK